MGRIAGIPNKLTSEVKQKLQTLVEGVVDTLDITEMTIDQKLKLLQITSQYILPRLKSVLTEQVKDEDLPLFMDQCQISAKKLTNFSLRFNCKKNPSII